MAHGQDLEQKAVWRKIFFLCSSRRMQCSWLSLLPLLLIHSASMFPEIFVALDIQLYKVADFDRVDFPSATVTDLRQENRVNQCNQQLFDIYIDSLVYYSQLESFMNMYAEVFLFPTSSSGGKKKKKLYAT